MACLCQGQFRIRTPNKRKPPTPTQKFDITTKALKELDKWALGGAIQPTVCVLVGDVNLNNLKKEVAMSICQHDVGEPDLDRHWHVESSNFALSGDVAFVKGAQPMPVDIATGACAMTRATSLE